MKDSRREDAVDVVGLVLAGAFLVGCLPGWWWDGGGLAFPVFGPRLAESINSGSPAVCVLDATLLACAAVACSLLVCWGWLFLADVATEVSPMARHQRRRHRGAADSGDGQAVCEQWSSVLSADGVSDLERELEALRAHARRLAEVAIREQRPDLYQHLVRRALVQVERGWERQTDGTGTMAGLLPRRVHVGTMTSPPVERGPVGTKEADARRGGRKAA